MANTKKNTEETEDVKVNTEIDAEKEALIEENKKQEKIIKELTDKNKESESTLEKIQKQMQEMQSAFIKMQSNNQNINTLSNKTYEIRSRFINGITIYSPNREIEREIPYDKTIELNEDEINLLLRSAMVKNFFVTDVIYFVDTEAYKNFKIYDHLELNDENFIKMITTYTSNELIVEFNKITREKREDALVHSLFYRVVDLYNKGQLNKMPHDTRRTIEKYFKCTIENAQMLLEEVRKVQ